MDKIFKSMFQMIDGTTDKKEEEKKKKREQRKLKKGDTKNR